MASTHRWQVMRAVLAALLATALAFTIAAASIRAGDRDVLVAPPEMAAENFIRAVATKRYEPARKHFTNTASRVAGVDELRVLGRDLHARVGQSCSVEGRAGSINSDHATAAAIVYGKSGAVKIELGLRFEDAEWKIDKWSPPLGRLSLHDEPDTAR